MLKQTLIGVLLLLLFLGAALANKSLRSHFEYENKFIEFMHQHKKSYRPEEFRYRFRVFQNNLDLIDNHNSKPNNRHVLAMNQFGDLTTEEFRSMFLGLKVPVGYVHEAPVNAHNRILIQHAKLPSSLDWRDKGVVSEVKDQQMCGSCWAFSTTGSVESCHKLAGGDLVSLSEQNLVDCSSDYGNQGCNGGLMTSAMDYIIANKGVDTEKSYPYKATDGDCQFKSTNVGATIKKYINVQAGDEGDLLQQIQKGPVSVAIDAGHYSFQFYRHGVYDESNCSPTNLDHGVLLVGYGSDDEGNEYWIVKNSWGTSWGMDGYILMARNKDNQCGIATMASRPEC